MLAQTMNDTIETALRDAVETHLHARADHEGCPHGTLVRFIIITEELTTGNSRRPSWISRDCSGEGLYPWETMGLLRHATLDIEGKAE